MKVAICGGGVLALEMASFILDQRAQAKVFSPDLGGKLLKLGDLLSDSSAQDWSQTFDGLLSDVDWKKMVTPWSLRLMQEAEVALSQEFMEDLNRADRELSFQEYIDYYFLPLCELMKSVTKPSRVVRAHKRFLSRKEDIKNKSRLHDLFRLVYEIDAQKGLEEQKQMAPEAFEKFSQEVIDSLGKSFEGFEDFDYVVDASGHYSHPLWMGPAGTYALNEKEVDPKSVFYGVQSLEAFISIAKNSNRVTIIGSGLISGLAFLAASKLRPNHLRLITTESRPFNALVQSKKFKNLSAQVLNALQSAQEDYQKDIEQFEQKIKEWKELEPHVRAKKPRPAEPLPRLEVYTGTNITSVDKLVDREGVFLTLESPDFRESNLEDGLKTIDGGVIFVGNGHSYQDIFDQTQRPFLPGGDTSDIEPGLFSLRLSWDGLDDMSKIIQESFDEMAKYFSREFTE